MSKDEPRRRFRDRFSLNLKDRSGISRPSDSVPVSGCTPNERQEPSISTSARAVSSSKSRALIESHSRLVPVLPTVGINSALTQTNTPENPGEAHSEKVVLSDTPHSAVVEPSLWALAYSNLKKDNPALIKRFNYCLGISTTDTDDEDLDSSKIEEVVQNALKDLIQVKNSKERLNSSSAVIRRYFEKAVKAVIASKDYISLAVSANPYAALAYTGVSLLLPLLLSPTQENEAAIKGLDDIAILIVVYRWREKNYLHDKDAVLDFTDSTIPLYTAILEYEATLLVHMYQKPQKRWIRNMFQAGDWSDRMVLIQGHDTKCRDVTNAIENVRANEWRDEERKRQDKLLKYPRQKEDRRNIRMLYSNYEAGKNVNPGRIAGTCQWFLNHTFFLTWRESQSSSLLWLSADPGCGKSVLSKYLVDRKGEVLTVHAETPTVCYFFFKDGDVNRVDGTKAMCAFLHQLIMQQPDLYEHIKDDFENKSEEFLGDLDALWNLFVEAATNATGREIICVLDALDECREDSRKALTAKLVELYRSNPSSKPILKFLVTSRPEFSIVRDFKELTSTLSEVRLHGEQESEQISREIDIVIRYKVDELGSRMDLSESDKIDLQENLIKVPHRTYLWLYLTFDAVAKKLELSKDDIAVIAKTIPKNVDEAYTAILNKSPDRKRARTLLHIVLAATRPLTLQEANVAIVLKEGSKFYKDIDIWQPDVSEDRIKNMCGLFLNVVDLHIYLIHQTAKEFLVCEDNTDSSSAVQAYSSAYWKKSFYSAQSNLVLAKICIWYLQFQEFEDEIAPAAMEIKELRDYELVVMQYEGKYIFFSYVARNWPFHFSRAMTLPEPALIKTVAYRICSNLSRCYRIWVFLWCEANIDNHFTVHDLLCLTSLQLGSLFGHEAVVELLLDHENMQTVPEDNENPQSALSLAAMEGHKAVIRLLLGQDNIQVNAKDDNYGRTALSWAATNGHELVVRLLLGHVDVQVNAKDINNLTALSWAATNGHEAVVRLLLGQVDIQINSKDSKYGQTALTSAIIFGHEAVVRLLLGHVDVQVNAKDDNYNRTALSWAATKGHEAVVRLLLGQVDIQVNAKDDNYGRTALSWAAMFGHESAVRLLLGQDDIQVNAKDPEFGQTALLLAATRGYEAVVRLLLGHVDIQINEKDVNGITALSWAARNGHEAVVRLLLGHVDVQVNANDGKYGYTALSWAAKYGYEPVVRLLLKQEDIQPDSIDDFGDTPLSLAVKQGYKGTVELLLEQKDVQTSWTDEDGRTLLWWARKNGHEAVIKLLLEWHVRDEVETMSGVGM